MARDSRVQNLRSALGSMIGSAPQTPPPPRRFLPASRYWRNVLMHVAVGSVLALALRLAPDTGWLATRQDQAMDWMVRMLSGTSPDDYRGAPFVFLDIDEETYRGWGEPLQVPRDRLARLLDFAVGGGAALVVVDVDLSRPTGPPDRLLESSLRALPPDAPPVLLARGFRSPLPSAGTPWREERTSFLDPVVAAAPAVHWASTLFIREPDYRIRRFRNFEPVCNADEPGVVPAVQLLGAALWLDPENGSRRLEQAMQAHRPACAGAAGGAAAEDRVLRFGEVEIALTGDRIASRILFNFGDGRSDPSVDFGGREVSLLTRVPARLVGDGTRALAAELVRDRIVLIGASHSESRDLHLTPLGEMPGALIVANAMYSLLQHGSLQPPSTAVLFALQLALVVLVSLAFAGVGFVVAAAIATPLVVALLLPLTFWFFRQGVWLDFAIPLVGVQAQAIAQKWAERYAMLRGRLRTRTLAPAEEACEPDEAVDEEEPASATERS